MEQIEIRNAVVDDAVQLAELSMQLGYPSLPQQLVTRLKLTLESTENIVLVACLPDGLVVGWIHVFFAHRIESDPFAELGGFIVAEQYRGCGVGRALLATAEDWVNRSGITTLRVRSRSTRSGARAFYKQMGFSLTKEQCIFDKSIR